MRLELTTGSTFAHYRIEGLVGRGGMGVVYRATDISLERPVALKLIAPELAEDERFRSRFLRESRLAASLDHPGVVPIYEAGEQDGQLFIAMRFVEGDDLHALLRREETLAPERALAVCGQVADALDAAHAKGLVHRDVKPGNVLLDGREHAYLSDFGLTKQLGGASTETGQVVGTFDYLAPEQIRGEEVDASTDSYSLACVLYECLAGRPPFRRQTEAEVLWAHMQEQPPPLAEHAPLDAVFERALAKEKDERYGSCGELIDAAREALRIGTSEGVATIMFTDVEGSTALTTHLGDVVAKELIEEQRQIVREQVAAHGGRVIDSIGDGFMVAFESTRRALVCALTVQQAMLERGRSDPARALRLRIGLNAGEVLERDGHPFGAAVNAAQRVAAAAKGGEVLASDAVRQLAGTIPGISFRDRGRVRLKGFREAWRLYEILSADRAEESRIPWRAKLPTPPRAALGRLRAGRRLALLGAVLAAGAIAAVVATLLTGEDSQLVAPGNAVAAIDPSGERVLAYTEVGTTPSNLVVGEDSVWVLNADDQTISRIDPGTRSIVRTFGTGGVPTDLAVGEGAVWVGNAGSPAAFDFSGSVTSSILRIDPDTGTVLKTQQLPGRTPSLSGEYRNSGIGQLAVGAGGVWAINPNLTISRIDPATGMLDKQIDAEATSAIAAGNGGVWFVGEDPVSVTRIDPKTNRLGQKIDIHAEFLSAVAVGAGSVWAAAPSEGLVWRIEPGRPPLTRSIEVGFGGGFLAFGDGALWVGNDSQGTVSRIDPRANRVTAKVTVAGTPVGLAPGGGSTWVSVTGGTSDGLLPESSCRDVVSGGAEPDVLIASGFPLQGPPGAATRPMADVIRFVLREHGFRAGEHTVGYQSCDDSSAQSGTSEFFKCSANAKAYAQAERLVAVIGPFFSLCASVQISILNRAEGGPLALVSPTNTYAGLTRATPGTGRGEPQTYYPTGVRNFFRVIALGDYQWTAGALLAKELGLQSAYVLNDDGGAFRRTARKIRLELAGSGMWEPRAESYAPVAERVARSGAQGVFLGCFDCEGGDRLVKALRARLGRRIVLIAQEAFLPIPDLLDAAGPAALGMYVISTGVPVGKLAPAGRSLMREFVAAQPPGTSTQWVAETAQAAEVVLQAIARSDGTRESVLRELRATRVSEGVLGRFTFDRFGDIVPSPVAVYRVTGKTTPSPDVLPDFQGAVVDRVIRIPESLTP